MRTPTYLDAVVIGLPLLLGLLGIRSGLRLSLVSWPVRWCAALAAGSTVATVTIAYIAFNTDLVAQLHALGPIATPIVRVVVRVVSFLLPFVVVLVVLGRVRDRVLDRIGDSFIGGAERILGGTFGVAFGLLLVTWLVVTPFMFYETMRPNPQEHPPWMREAMSMPYVKSAADMTKRAVFSYAPPR